MSLWVSLRSLLGPLEVLLKASGSKNTKKLNGFLRFLKMQLFGSLKLLMALLGSSCPLFGRSGPKMGPNKVPKNAHQRNQKLSKFFFFLHFWEPFLRAILKTYKTTFGTQNGPGFLQKNPKIFTRETKMSPRGPS